MRQNSTSPRVPRFGLQNGRDHRSLRRLLHDQHRLPQSPDRLLSHCPAASETLPERTMVDRNNRRSPIHFAGLRTDLPARILRPPPVLLRNSPRHCFNKENVFFPPGSVNAERPSHQIHHRDLSNQFRLPWLRRAAAVSPSGRGEGRPLSRMRHSVHGARRRTA